MECLLRQQRRLWKRWGRDRLFLEEGLQSPLERRKLSALGGRIDDGVGRKRRKLGQEGGRTKTQNHVRTCLWKRLGSRNVLQYQRKSGGDGVLQTQKGFGCTHAAGCARRQYQQAVKISQDGSPRQNGETKAHKHTLRSGYIECKNQCGKSKRSIKARIKTENQDRESKRRTRAQNQSAESKRQINTESRG